MKSFILVLNSGSSSVKFNLFQLTAQNTLQSLLEGIAEEIGNVEKSRIKYDWQGTRKQTSTALANHQAALLQIFEILRELGIDRQSIAAVGHRVVHGGELYSSSVRIDDSVIDTIRNLIPIAPLHNPPNLTGIEESIKLLPDVPQVAVFDTAFHESMPEYAFRYAIPEKWLQEYGVRKYGFHGTSHMYVARRAARFLGIPFSQFNGITAHLGNGCSLTKIQKGRSMDTSMGFTPLEGVVMGTRSGDIDPALIEHVAAKMAQEENLPLADAYQSVFRILNKEGGLKALSQTNMMQDIRSRAGQGDLQAKLAIEIYAYRVAKYIGQYWATLPWTDAIVFTAGLGENESLIREMIISYLQPLSIRIDADQNQIRKQEVVIGTSRILTDHPLSVMVIPTNEEIVIGYDTLFLGYYEQPIPDVYPFEQ